MVDIISRLRLVVDSSGMDRAGRSLRDLRNDARQADSAASRLKTAFAGLSAVIGGLGVREVIKMADGWKRVENQLKTVERSMFGVRAAQEGVFVVAQKTYSAFEATGTLYAKLSRSGAGLIAGQKEALRIVETVNKALAVGGASAGERNSVILQLGQAIGSGRLQGDEFRSISENAPLILDALAKSTGKARGELKALGSEGKITSAVLIKALKEYGDEVDKTFGSFAPAMADAFTQLQNALQKLIGQNGASLFDGIAAVISWLAKNLDALAKAAVVAGSALAAYFGVRTLTQMAASFTALQASIALTNAQLAAAEFRANLATGALGRVTVASASAAAGSRALAGAIALVGGPIGLIAIALTAAAVAFYEFSDGMKVATADGGKFVSQLDGIKGEVIEYSVTVQDVLGEIPGYIGDVFHGLSKSVGAWIKTAFGPHALDDVLSFFMSLVDAAKKSVNFQIALFVGLPKAIAYSLATLPTAVSEVFINAYNAAGKALSDFINKHRAAINIMLKAISLITRAPIPEVPETHWTPMVNGVKGAAKSIGDAWKSAFSTDYVGGFVNGIVSASSELRLRAEQRKRSEAEQAALAAKSSGLGGGGAAADAGKEAANAFGKAFKEGLAADALSDFDKAFRQGLFKAMDGGADVVRDWMRDFNQANAATAGQQLFMANLDSVKTKEDLRYLLDYQRAYEAIAAKAEKVGDLNQAAVDAEYKRLSAARLVNEEYERRLRAAMRLENLDRDAATDRAEDDFFHAADRFWFDFLKNGDEALKNFGASFKDIILGAFADGLRAAAEPFVQWFSAELKKAVSDIFSVIKDGFTGLLKKSGILKVGDDGKLALNADNAIAKLFKAGMTAFAGYQIGQMGANALGMGGKGPVTQQNSQVGSAIGSAIGTAIAGPIGAAIGGLLGGAVGGLFGKESNRTAGVNFDAAGNMTGGGIYGSKRTSETEGALKTVMTALDAAKGALKDLGGQTSIFVKQLEIGVRDPGWAMLSNGRNLKTAVGDPTALANAVGIELLRATTFSVDALNKIRDGMLGAGKSFDDTVVTLQQVQSVLKSNQPALSEWEQKLKDIDGVFKPLIAATGAYSSALQDAYNAAKGAVVADYNKDIENQLKGILNGPTDQLNEMLEMQAKRLEEAKKLGANLDQVNRLTALEQRDFFKGLSDDALKEVQSFLGLFEEATNSVVRNLDMSRQDLRSRADTFAGFAEQFTQLNADFTERFLAASPRESIGVLRGRVNELLIGVGQGNESAAQALPQAINKLVDAARASYGNTAGFNEVLAFAQNALMQAKDSALKVQTDAEKQIAALDANNDILADIRDILASSQASNAFFQSYLNGGAASSDALLALIQRGAGLTPANDNASALNITGLIAQSVQPIIAPLASSIDAFTARLSDLPNLQRLTIEHIDRGADRIVAAIDRLDQRMDRIEILNKKQLEELEQANEAA